MKVNLFTHFSFSIQTALYFPGMEIGHTLWLVWDTDNNPSCHFLEHQKKSRLADWEDARSGFYGLCPGKMGRVLLFSRFLVCAHALSKLGNFVFWFMCDSHDRFSTCSMGTWTKKNGMWSWESLDQDLAEYWSLQICWWVARSLTLIINWFNGITLIDAPLPRLVALMYSRCLWS